MSGRWKRSNSNLRILASIRGLYYATWLLAVDRILRPWRLDRCAFNCRVAQNEFLGLAAEEIEGLALIP